MSLNDLYVAIVWIICGLGAATYALYRTRDYIGYLTRWDFVIYPLLGMVGGVVYAIIAVAIAIARRKRIIAFMGTKVLSKEKTDV